MNSDCLLRVHLLPDLYDRATVTVGSPIKRLFYRQK